MPRRKTTPPPPDWADEVGWDRYWESRLTDAEEQRWYTLSGALDRLGYLERLRARGHSRILFAGNGANLEPWAFVHAGFTVTAVDLSRVACAFLERPPSAAVMARLLPAWDELAMGTHTELRHNAEKSAERVAREHRPGGTIEVLHRDLFRWEPSERFHFIVSSRAFQGFVLEQQRELAQRFFRWLTPGGTCFLETINLSGERFDETWSMFRDAGFFGGAEVEVWRWHQRELEAHQRGPRSGREARLERLQREYAQKLADAEQEAERRRVAGDRLIVLYNGSG